MAEIFGEIAKSYSHKLPGDRSHFDLRLRRGARG